jgi:hypothetical protein
MRLLILTIQLHEDRDFDGAGCWKNAVTVKQKNPAIGQVENGDAHHTFKLVSDVADVGIELFPQQSLPESVRVGSAFCWPKAFVANTRAMANAANLMCGFSPRRIQ